MKVIQVMFHMTNVKLMNSVKFSKTTLKLLSIQCYGPRLSSTMPTGIKYNNNNNQLQTRNHNIS